MKRVIIVPVTEIGQFPGMEMLVRGDALRRLQAILLKREPEAHLIRRSRFSMRSAAASLISIPQMSVERKIVL